MLCGNISTLLEIDDLLFAVNLNSRVAGIMCSGGEADIIVNIIYISVKDINRVAFILKITDNSIIVIILTDCKCVNIISILTVEYKCINAEAVESCCNLSAGN